VRKDYEKGTARLRFSRRTGVEWVWERKERQRLRFSEGVDGTGSGLVTVPK
jgi:hypothetical protein